MQSIQLCGNILVKSGVFYNSGKMDSFENLTYIARKDTLHSILMAFTSRSIYILSIHTNMKYTTHDPYFQQVCLSMYDLSVETRS